MSNKQKKPKLDSIATYLEEFGWDYRRTEATDKTPLIITPLILPNKKGILTNLSVTGEFVMVSTHGLMKQVPTRYSLELLELNDTLKLCKLFCIDNKSNKMKVELGFELWGNAWHKDTFSSFLHMLSLGAQKVLDYTKGKNIKTSTVYIEFEDPA